jgi:dihydroorotase-like cyclic amidohydrolase
VLFDPSSITRVDAAFTKSRSRNSPFWGKDLAGRVELVVLGDRVLLDRTV